MQALIAGIAAAFASARRTSEESILYTPWASSNFASIF